MFLYFDGCSHTWGQDLEDNLNERFSTLVSNHFSADHENGSKKGSSNDEITERTLTFIKNNPCDFGVVLMTYETRFKFNPVYKTITPGIDRKRWSERHEISEIFFSKLFTSKVGSIQFYKNRFILEQAFKKKGIPLILLQWINLKYDGECVYKDYCEGSLPLITSWILPSLLGLPKVKEYFYSEHLKEVVGHPNKKGHRKIADLIIELIDTH